MEKSTYKVPTILSTVAKSSLMPKRWSTETARQTDTESWVRKSYRPGQESIIDGVLSSVSLDHVVDPPSSQPTDEQGSEDFRVTVLSRNVAKSQKWQNKNDCERCLHSVLPVWTDAQVLGYRDLYRMHRFYFGISPARFSFINYDCLLRH